MKKKLKYSIIFFIILIIAIALRLPRLAQRPMHTDEAVHAVKFGELLEKGYYHYDSNEFHGPTLNYLTLVPAWLNSSQKFEDISEDALRIVPVFFGVMLVLLLLFLTDGLGWSAIIFTALLTAISPAMVYYSRYYIQEMLLVCFTFGAIISNYRYLKNKNLNWAICSGLFLGLMHATKETCIIAFASMVLALLLMLMIRKKESGSIFDAVKTINRWHGLAACAVAILISALFYSSFLTNAQGIVDSLKTYTTYFQRAGQNEVHIHPWYYYLKMLGYHRIAEGPVWSEIIIIAFACVGIVAALTKRCIKNIDVNLIRFFAFYTIIMTSLYSVIPYKTPLCMLGFLHGKILLAGVGAVVILNLQTKFLVRILISALLFIGLSNLSWQAYLTNYKYEADPTNPYVYAHTSPDIFKITQRIQEVAQASNEKQNIYIEVICPGDDYWPLPWYLRSFPNVGWWNKVNLNVPAAPLIIAMPDVESALTRKLYELPPPGQKNLYLPLFDSYTELRPQVELRGYIVKELWDRFQKSQAKSIKY